MGVVHYLAEAVYHVCRIVAYADGPSISSKLFKVGDLLFVLARLSSVILGVLTFWYGLARAPVEEQTLDMAAGNFNTPLVRLNALVAVCLLQAWLMWNFIMFQVKRMREASAFSSSSGGSAGSKARKEKKEQEQEQEEDELPEADQKLRQRVK